MSQNEDNIKQLIILEKKVVDFRLSIDYWEKVELDKIPYKKISFYEDIIIHYLRKNKKVKTKDIIKFIHENYKDSLSYSDYVRVNSGNIRMHNFVYSAITKLRKNGKIKQVNNKKSEFIEINDEILNITI